jgi:RNA polymerase sigma factor (TIGR02999 family)
MIQLNETTTHILEEFCENAKLDAEVLLPVVYDELKRIAARELARERPDHTLQPTALVHEAYIRMAQLRQVRWEDRRHFCGVAAHVIRRVLIDHERARRAAKRGGEAERLTLHDQLTPSIGRTDYDLFAVNEALEELERLNPRHAQIVEMRFFAGFTIDETAAILGLSPATVKTDWRMARAWLKSQLTPV